MSSQTVWLPTALYTALIRWQMDDFTAIGFVNAIFGDKAESCRYVSGVIVIPSFIGI
jgi:hypothetical protein